MTGVFQHHIRYAVSFAAACVVALALCVEAKRAHGQDQTVAITEFLKQRRQELRVTDGRLDGPASRWLREEASKAQFLFIGEEHDTSEIPVITGALWREIVPLGYRHAAIEAGQWLGGRLDRFARFDDPKALAQFKSATLPRRPNISVPPSSEEDIAFYESLGQAGHFHLPLVWGLDHEFRVAPLLARLLELTPDGANRRRIESALTKVADAEKSGKYNMQPFKPEIEAIAGNISARPGSEAAQIQDALRRRVFGDEFDQPRSDVFKQLFLRNYRAAQAAGETKPKVLLRFGGWHAKRGMGGDYGYGVPTFANFVAEFAYLEGGQTLNVRFSACSMISAEDWRAPKSHPRPCSPSERVWVKPFLAAAASQWTLFDLRELRKPLREGKLNVEGEVGQIIASYDALVLLKDSARAHFQP
ncbi:MAG: hypothetical protein J2P52_13725 [Blastocatellia bacterium]|nr:hypothetical protein [Blastocatellia bacterium]